MNVTSLKRLWMQITHTNVPQDQNCGLGHFDPNPFFVSVLLKKLSLKLNKILLLSQILCQKHTV